MATNLPQSRNRNLPQPPAEPAELRRRVMTPLPGPQQEPGRLSGLLRSLAAMLAVCGLLFAGIWIYLRGSDTDSKQQEALFNSLQAIGAEVWESRGLAAPHAETEERRKDREDLPRIFTAAQAGFQKSRAAPRIVPIEGDPPPGNGNASHQINYYFGDMLGIVLRVRYDDKSDSFSFIGVHNRIVPARSELRADAAAPEPSPVPPPEGNLPAPSSTDIPPAAPVLAPPVEKVSEPPANPP